MSIRLKNNEIYIARLKRFDKNNEFFPELLNKTGVVSSGLPMKNPNC